MGVLLSQITRFWSAHIYLIQLFLVIFAPVLVGFRLLNNSSSHTKKDTFPSFEQFLEVSFDYLLLANLNK